MNRCKLISMRVLLSIVYASLLAGCAASGDTSVHSNTATPAPQISPANDTLPVMPADAKASINNPRDLAAAQPDTIFAAAQRDLPATPGAGGTVTYQTLGEMLRQIDPQVQDRQTIYQLLVKFKSDDGLEWATPFGVSLSKGGDFIWLTCVLAPVNTENPELLKNLLSANSILGDNFFAITYDTNKRLEIVHGVPNMGVTPDMLLANLNNLLLTDKRCEPLYKLVINVP